MDLSNYATKADLKNKANIYTWKFAKKAALAYLKYDLNQ